MDTLTIFLSGSVKKGIDSLNIGKEYWETQHEQKLINNIKPSVLLLNPNSVALDKDDREGRFRADLNMLLSSDIVLVDAVKKKGIGIGAEMAIAKQWKIPVFTIAPIGSHYRQYDSLGNEWIHPFIYELSDKIFGSIDEFICYINECYENNSLCMNRLNANSCIDKLIAFDGGYDEGYSSVENFWGEKPAQLVVECAERVQADFKGEKHTCLDLGCGTGKNTVYLTKKGFTVTPIDASFYAIEEARKKHPDISWKVRDIRKVIPKCNNYHAIIMTGSLHYLKTESEIEEVVSNAQKMTCVGGYNVLSAFNNTEQDLSGHVKSFAPVLLDHEKYLDMYKGWTIIKASNTTQADIHLHNNIPHFHSITRILARKHE